MPTRLLRRRTAAATTREAPPAAPTSARSPRPTDGQITTSHPPAYKPFSSESGKIVGFDVDIVDHSSQELGVKQTVVDPSVEASSPARTQRAQCALAAAA
jgi:ABC-type amino acid transport substrate-binding protein